MPAIATEQNRRMSWDEMVKEYPDRWVVIKDAEMDDEMLERICYLVGHHHTTSGVDGLDYQILLEADFLVNAGENNMSAEAIAEYKKNVFKTQSGIRLLDDLYGDKEE